ncbi:methyltransferase domain-containing protein, partial [Listeria monocytogenes]|uniref:methyltransferase domain-containing protein n=1 Tax=Listeria monocytogenes TaxID=1639 RepID=UPI003204F824
MNLKGILPFAHDTLRKVVRPGDYVIDATCGNGHDTLLLAELVGINGHVLGFDIQQMA